MFSLPSVWLGVAFSIHARVLDLVVTSPALSCQFRLAAAECMTDVQLLERPPQLELRSPNVRRLVLPWPPGTRASTTTECRFGAGSGDPHRSRSHSSEVPCHIQLALAEWARIQAASSSPAALGLAHARDAPRTISQSSRMRRLDRRTFLRANFFRSSTCHGGQSSSERVTSCGPSTTRRHPGPCRTRPGSGCRRLGVRGCCRRAR